MAAWERVVFPPGFALALIAHLCQNAPALYRLCRSLSPAVPQARKLLPDSSETGTRCVSAAPRFRRALQPRPTCAPRARSTNLRPKDKKDCVLRIQTRCGCVRGLGGGNRFSAPSDLV